MSEEPSSILGQAQRMVEQAERAGQSVDWSVTKQGAATDVAVTWTARIKRVLASVGFGTRVQPGPNDVSVKGRIEWR